MLKQKVQRIDGIIKQIHTFTSNISFFANKKKLLNNNLLLVNVWICLMIPSIRCTFCFNMS